VLPRRFALSARSPEFRQCLGSAQSRRSPRLPFVSTRSVLVRFLPRAKCRGIDGLRLRAPG
jgi:hypothetical protein